MINEIEIVEFLRNPPDKERIILVDIRETLLYNFGTIPGALNIPIDKIAELYDLPKDKTIYVFCQTGEFSREIVTLLTDAGYRAYNLLGGYREYIRNCQLLSNAFSAE